MNNKKLLTFLLAGSIVSTSVPVYPATNVSASAVEDVVVEGENQNENTNPKPQAVEPADVAVESAVGEGGSPIVVEGANSEMAGAEESLDTADSVGDATPEISLGANIAAKAEASAEYVNNGTSVSNVNNGKLATDASTSWNTWKSGGIQYPTWVQLDWGEQEYEISGMRVIWWADNADRNGEEGVTFPKSCRAEYWDGSNWVPITNMKDGSGAETGDQVGVAVDASSNNGLNGHNKLWNYVSFDAVKTSKIRLQVERSGSKNNGLGISEWEVFGVKPIGEGDNIAIGASAAADYSNSDTPAANVNNGQEATADSKTSWNTWKKEGDLAYPTPITLTWEKEQEISSMQVQWWADNEAMEGDQGVKFPKEARLQYFNSQYGRWVDITDMVDETGAETASVGVKYGQQGIPSDNPTDYVSGKNKYWNGVTLKTPVKTKQLRMLVDRPGTGQSGIGISEWKVYGDEIMHTIGDAPSIGEDAKIRVEYTNNDTSPDNINDGKLAGNAKTTWNTWKDGEPLTYPQPVEFEWNKPHEISSMQVMWWADNAGTEDGVTFPKSCKVEYYDLSTNTWKEITAMTDETGNAANGMGVKYGSASSSSNNAKDYLQGKNRYWNGVLFDQPVRTTKLRLIVDRPGTGRSGIGIGECKVYGDEITAEWDQLIGAQITGKEEILKGETVTYTGNGMPEGLEGLTYEWSLIDDGNNTLEIVGDTTGATVDVKAVGKSGTGKLGLTVTYKGETRSTEYTIDVDAIDEIQEYETSTAVGREPILPKTVVAEGLTFDDPTPSKKTKNNDKELGENFDSKLVPVEWEEVDPQLYSKAGDTFEVVGTVTVGSEKYEAKAKVSVKDKMVAPEANSTVTFENVSLTDEFWNPKQKVNAVNSLNASINQIAQPSGGEPNFINAIKKLNGEPYDQFQGFVFQDSDIYKSIEAISYTLSVINDDTDPELVAQKKKLEDKLQEWISYIEQVQYADGYINTHFTLRSQSISGGRSAGTHRWNDFSNHEMYNAGHFFEAVVAYTRYREGIGSPDYSLYVVGKRFADQIVNLFGPNGSRHEVPGHEEIELALVKLAKLVEEYEGVGAGQKYIDTAKLLIDRRGEDSSLRDSGYNGYVPGQRDYSQDATPIKEETEGVGHAVRACYLYAGVTDVATLLPEGDADRAAYLNSMDSIWDSVANTKTYITGGIGVAKHGEDFGAPYELPNNGSYCETCASIALANWNQRMNLVHEDAKYADVVEKTLYNAILVGTNLEGNKFFYNSLLEVANGNKRSDWFACACCPPNLMRTIAKLSEYMYTVHGDDVFVNMYIGSDGHVNVGGTTVNLKQETAYPWDGDVKLTVTPDQSKEFAMKIRIPGWTQEQNNKSVNIAVNGKRVTTEAVNGYVAIHRTWKAGDVIRIEMPMEIRKTEADPNVTTNAGRIALERGPIVYCMEKAGNAQINNDGNFNPLNFVIPRDADLKAEYNPDLLNGVVEITGEVLYQNGSNTVPAQIQAVPYYAWNNRGDNGVQGQNSSSKMLIWTKTEGSSVMISGEKDKIEVDETVTLTASSEGGKADDYTWTVKEGDSVELTGKTDGESVTVKGIKEGTSIIQLTATQDGEKKTAEFQITVGDTSDPEPSPDPDPSPNPTPNPNPGPSTGDDDIKVEVDQTDKGDASDKVANLLEKDETGATVSVSGKNTSEVAEISVDVKEEGLNAGDKVSLYRYDEKADKLVDTGKTYTVGEDGKVLMEITENGTYVLAKVVDIEVADVTAPKSVTTTKKATLTWDAVEDADSYRIYRYNRTTKKYEKIAEVKDNKFVDEDVKAGTGYLYKVRAVVDGKKNHFSDYTKAFRVLTKTASPTGVKAKRTSTVSSKATAEISFKKAAKATAYRIYKYDKKADKYQLTYQVKNGKLFSFNSKTKKFKKVGTVKEKNGTMTCKLTNLNLRAEKSQSYKVRSVIAKEKYTTQYSAMSKAVTIK